ncbi:hypothetical protein [Methanocella arvoryzae]|nr:hypothetical protein [Methanocella arvoryzae]
MTQKGIYSAGVLLIVVAMLSVSGCASAAASEDAKDAINKTLVGHNLTYYSIAGKPMNYTITSEDIVSIEPVTYKDANAWKVRVGKSLPWDLTMSSDGTEILYVDQLFRT